MLHAKFQDHRTSGSGGEDLHEHVSLSYTPIFLLEPRTFRGVHVLEGHCFP